MEASARPGSVLKAPSSIGVGGVVRERPTLGTKIMASVRAECHVDVPVREQQAPGRFVSAIALNVVVIALMMEVAAISTGPPSFSSPDVTSSACKRKIGVA